MACEETDIIMQPKTVPYCSRSFVLKQGEGFEITKRGGQTRRELCVYNFVAEAPYFIKMIPSVGSKATTAAKANVRTSPGSLCSSTSLYLPPVQGSHTTASSM